MPDSETPAPRAARATRAQPIEPRWLRDEATIALRLLIMAAAFIVAVWLVMQVQLVAVAAFIGFALVALLWPLVRVLRRFLPRVLASLLVVTVFVAFFGCIVLFVAQRVVNTWPDLLDAVIGGIQEVNRAAINAGWEIPQELIDNLTRQLRDTIGAVASGIGSFAITGLSAVANLVTILLIAVFATIFVLTSGDDLWRSILGVFPARRRAAADAAFRKGFVTARWWMLASTVTGLVDGVFIGLGLYVLDVPLAVPIGAATFILGYIPMVGATLAGALAVIVALFFGGIDTALWTLGLVLAVQQIEGNVLSPLLLSRAVQFHPVITLLLSTGGGIAFGITGLFLAVPVAGILTAVVVTWRRVGEEDPDEHDVEDVDDGGRGALREEGPAWAEGDGPLTSTDGGADSRPAGDRGGSRPTRPARPG